MENTAQFKGLILWGPLLPTRVMKGTSSKDPKNADVLQTDDLVDLQNASVRADTCQNYVYVWNGETRRLGYNL